MDSIDEFVVVDINFGIDNWTKWFYRTDSRTSSVNLRECLFEIIWEELCKFQQIEIHLDDKFGARMIKIQSLVPWYEEMNLFHKPCVELIWRLILGHGRSPLARSDQYRYTKYIWTILMITGLVASSPVNYNTIYRNQVWLDVKSFYSL